jgi:DNA helicase IV
MTDFKSLKKAVSSHRDTDKQFYLDLLDGDKQKLQEDEHMDAVMLMLRVLYINRFKLKIKSAEDEITALTNSTEYNAEQYKRVLALKEQIQEWKNRIDTYRCFFEEPYFARMDLTDDKEGYNSYYIGKHGDEGLEIVDWRAPLARKYYQKSQINFAINEYNYKLVLRRALRTKNAKVLDMQNEYLSVKDQLTKEEIAGRDEEIIFDPFLKDILKSRKEKSEITDIIETIQEKQYEIITLPEDKQFVVQGVAGSGKTMIMLHRLSYLMYNNENIKPRDVLVITPSDSFNAFIEELSEILELEKVKTQTLESYFITLLKNEGIILEDKIDRKTHVAREYLNYIYSQKFVKDIEKKLTQIYTGVYGMFASDECKETNEAVVDACTRQIVIYDKIKNAGLRVRRCVLGEIKEKPDGGLYYTKQFRALFNAVTDVKEFLTLNLNDARMKNYAYFYKQLLSFYKSLRFIRRYSRKICSTTIDDLKVLSQTLEKEMTDLRRYRSMGAGGVEVYTYADRIALRESTLKEIERTIDGVETIAKAFDIVCEFADVLQGDNWLVAIGKCDDVVGIARFFYREIIKKIKTRYGVSVKQLYPSDPYILCLMLCKLGFSLSPRNTFVFVDEGQDISAPEYWILKTVNETAYFNIFGDLKQNITGFRGVSDWNELGYDVYTLNQNYRNTNQIVSHVSEKLGIDMQAIGFDGEEIDTIAPRGITQYLTDKKGLRAVITSEKRLEDFIRKSYNVVGQTGVISKKKINVMTVYESKGLEFTAVAVVDWDMTDNEKYIAYTRALKQLAIVKKNS